jgi:hypothetical protein
MPAVTTGPQPQPQPNWQFMLMVGYNGDFGRYGEQVAYE